MMTDVEDKELEKYERYLKRREVFISIITAPFRLLDWIKSKIFPDNLNKVYKNMNDIKFYSSGEEYGCFSNFSKHPIELNRNTWQTSEHYYQAQKFAGTVYEAKIREANGPMQAATEGRDKSKPLRKDWETVKEDIMYDAIYAKFTQHKDLQEILLSTDDSELIEDSPVDYYWGCGKDGTGKNRLGVLLMRLRDELREEDEHNRN